MTHLINTQKTVPAIAVIFSIVIGLILSTLSFTALSAESVVHKGLHLRFGVGIVAGWGNVDTRESTVEVGGPGVLDGVQLGVATENSNKVFFEADSLVLLSVNKNIEPSAVKSDDRDEQAAWGFFTGAGVGHYFSQTGMYLSGALGVSYNNVVTDDSDIDFDRRNLGFGYTVSAGKEWGVTCNWAMGIGVQMLHMVNRGEQGTGFNRHTFASGLIFTTSFV